MSDRPMARSAAPAARSARKRVLAIGAKLDEPDLFAKARALGIDVVWVQHPHLADPAQLEVVAQAHLLDYTDRDALLPLVRSLHAAQPFDAVFCLTEPGLMTAAELALGLGLRFTRPSTVHLLRDKWAMRQLLDAHGISPVRAATGTTAAELAAFLRDVACPAIVKPIDGGGSFGVALLRSPGEAEAAFARLTALGVRSFIVEEYLTGPEISVEAFSFAGRHVVVACTDKLSEETGFVELGHAIPARLDAAAHAQVVELVGRLLDVVKYTDGPSHTEIKLTPLGPKIIEGHDRLGGDRINTLVRLAYGVDLVETTFTWACGLGAPFAPPPLRAGSAIRYLVPPAGTLRAVRGLEAVRAQPDVVALEWTVAVGGTIWPLTDSSARPGYVIVQGPDAASAAAAAARHAAAIEFDVEPRTAP